MTVALPPLDCHAHIDVDIADQDVRALNAVVLAMTRTLDEASEAVMRRDGMAIWGVGCHPGLVRSLKGFNAGRFEELLDKSAVVGEMGLDGSKTANLGLQVEVLSEALDILACKPRLVSLHSYQATGELVNLVVTRALKGVVLHWWLGENKETDAAIEAGCYFSINPSSARRTEILSRIPIDRLLTETDHPFGDRWGSNPRMPGRVSDVEMALGKQFRISAMDVRRRVWLNFSRLVRDVGCMNLLPDEIGSLLEQVTNSG